MSRLRDPLRLPRVLVFVLVASLSLVALGAVARADIIHLRNGGKIEGKVVKRTATEVVIKTKFGGTMKLPASKVLRIEKTTSVWDEYATRRAKIKATDAKGLFGLYEWCVEKKLTTKAKAVLNEVLSADPNHEAARAANGEIRVGGKWITPDEAKAAGYKLHEGRWLTHDEFMKATGHVKFGSKWIPERDYDKLHTKREMERVLNMELTVENSEHFGVRTRFPASHAKELLKHAEAAYDAFMKLIPYPPSSRRRWRRIEIYLFAELEEYQAFFDNFVFPKKLITDANLYEHYRDAGNCNLFYPRPIIVLRQSPALPEFKDQTALAIHNIGHMMLHRMRKDIYPPDWLEEGMGHWCEESVFGAARIFTLMPGKLTHRQLIVPGWRNSVNWRKKINRLLVPGEVPQWKVLMKKPLGGMTTKELAKVWAVLHMIADEKPKTLAAFLERATEHSWEQVFIETVGWTPAQVDTNLAAYIRRKF